MRSNARLGRRMTMSLKRKIVTKKSRRRLLAAGLIVLAVILIQRINTPDSINPAAYAPLLETIARGESGGNYNAYFGGAGNAKVRFTDMTIAEVLAWQEQHVQQGSISNAVGKYQIIRPTLLSLVEQLKIDHAERFDPAMQDRLAIALLERRGAREYIGGNLTREQFAANLAMEWAALPKTSGPNPHESYYASDGINKSNITIEEMYTALGMVHTLTRGNMRT